MQDIYTKAINIGHRSINYTHLNFETYPVVMTASQGTKYIREVEIGMPKIPDDILDCVFYLYRTQTDAENGNKTGGTGFLVGVSSKINNGRYYIYGVSNMHVVRNHKASIIRLNTIDGKTEIFTYSPHDWACITDKEDIAISPILPITDKHKIAYVHTELFVTDEAIAETRMGLGDNVFMLGRFVDHDGGVINKPSARFGNISVMPTPIKQENINDYEVDSYCIDLHSRTGYSGSPVFVYRASGINLELVWGKTRKFFVPSVNGFLYLLGIHWGQFPEYWELKSKSNRTYNSLNINDIHTEGASGMTCVIPAQKIMDLLYLPSVLQKREKEEIKLSKYYEKNGYPPNLE